jgi:hypothetical protein
MTTLLRELQAIEPALTALQVSRPPLASEKWFEWNQQRRELSKGVSDALADFDRYRGSENLMVTMGNGAGTIKPEFFLPRFLDVAAVHGSAFTVSALRKLLKAKSGRVTTSCLLWGVATERRVNLAPGIYLSPLPADPMPPVLRGEISRLPHHLQVKSSFAVLSSSFTVTPVVLEARDREAIPDGGVRAFEKLRDVAAILCAIGPSAVILEQKWDEFADPKLAAISPMGGPSIFMQEVLPFLPSGPAAIDAAAKLPVERFLNLPADLRGKLNGPLGRLNSGMRRRSPFDQALDCGIALEMLLLRDPLNTEISYRLALRAGLLLGKTLEERRELRADVAALYSLRSKAAHGSTTVPKNSQAIAQGGFAVCAAVIREIVRRGGFPKWDDLELGSQPPRATAAPRPQSRNNVS